MDCYMKQRCPACQSGPVMPSCVGGNGNQGFPLPYPDSMVRPDYGMNPNPTIRPDMPLGPGPVIPNRREEFPIAMAYVPWQCWQEVYPPDRALCRGTIFPELDKPFMMGRCR